jgi:hypothetical protein
MAGVQRRPLFDFPIRALYIKHLQAYNTCLATGEFLRLATAEFLL